MQRTLQPANDALCTVVAMMEPIRLRRPGTCYRPATGAPMQILRAARLTAKDTEITEPLAARVERILGAVGALGGFYC